MSTCQGVDHTAEDQLWHAQQMAAMVTMLAAGTAAGVRAAAAYVQ